MTAPSQPLYDRNDLMILLAAANLLGEARNRSLPEVWSNDRTSGDAFAIGEALGRCHTAESALRDAIVWHTVMWPDPDDSTEEAEATTEVDVTGLDVSEPATDTNGGGELVAIGPYRTCKIEGCERPSLAERGPYIWLCAEHRAEASAAHKWRLKAHPRKGAR